MPVVANAVAARPDGVFVYPWGDAGEIVRIVEAVLSSANGVPRPSAPPDFSDVPDTVCEEVELLVQHARSKNVSEVASGRNAHSS